jgi:hypothetical protein
VSRRLRRRPTGAALGQDHAPTRHGGIDVQPQLFAPRDLRDLGDGIEAVVAVRPQVATMAQGSRPAARSSAMAPASAADA